MKVCVCVESECMCVVCDCVCIESENVCMESECMGVESESVCVQKLKLYACRNECVCVCRR